MFGKKHNPLDDALLTWPDGTPFRVSDMLRSCEIKGITGSGKTSGSLQHILDALAAHPRATILAIAQKPEDRETFEDTFARAGKRKKLIVVDKSAKWRTNFIDVERAAGADARGIVEFLDVQKEMLSGGQAGGGTNEQFWRLSEERLLFNAVEAVRQGTGSVATPELMEFIATAPTSPQVLDGEKHPELRAAFEKKYHYQTMNAAAEREGKTDIERHDFNVITTYWANEFPAFDPEPRASIIAMAMNTLHAANTGLSRLISSTYTNISPRVFDEGYSVLIDFPFTEFGPTGRYIAGGWKYVTQKHILRRRWKPGHYFNVLTCDEFQESVSEIMDARYLSMCRSHGGCLLTATQTINSEYGAAGGGHKGHHKVDALLANFGHHIYHTVDPKTAQFASELLGHRLEMMPGGGEGDAPTELWDEIMGRGRQRWNFNYAYQPILQPAVLMSQRTGGAANGYCVDGIVIRLGERFLSGENYQFVTFRQR